MQIGDLHYLAASAHAGNFSRAASILGRNASTLSRRIGRLKDELGLSLFERRRSGIQLISGGSAVLVHVRRALTEIDAIKAVGLQSGLANIGEVRLGVRMPPIGKPIAGLLASWRAQHPWTTIKISELADRDLAVALEERRLDVALVPSFTLWANRHADKLVVEYESGSVDLVHRARERDELGLEIMRRCRDAMDAMEKQGRAEPLSVDGRLHIEIALVEAAHEADLEEPPTRAHLGFDQAQAVSGRHRQWFFAEHRLSELHARHAEIEMGFIGRCDQYGVDLRIINQCATVRFDFWNT